MKTNRDFERPQRSSKARNRAQLLFVPTLMLAISLFASASAWAAGSVLSGMFDGGEPSIEPIVAADCVQGARRYRQTTFEVSETGSYFFNDAFGTLSGNGGLDVTAIVYEGNFDALAPGQNLMATADVDFPASEVALLPGTTYTLVVQLGCTPSQEGAWAVTFTGPGGVSSDAIAPVPAFTLGSFTENDPIIDSQVFWDGWDGGSGPYQQSGPVQVSRSGTYYFSASNLAPVCLLVYTAPINPDDLFANLLTAQSFYGIIQLEAGQDYYFVVQQCHGDDTDEFVYVLAPPAPFRINHGLADSWYNPETPGQGFFLDVFEQLNQVFLGWFTFVAYPMVSNSNGHFWMTAFGSFAGTSADLSIEFTGGGAFNAAQPQPYQYEGGNIVLEFNDCTAGQVSYRILSDIGGVSNQGVIPIRRNVNDAVALCESLYAGPGMPGPL